MIRRRVGFVLAAFLTIFTLSQSPVRSQGVQNCTVTRSTCVRCGSGFQVCKDFFCPLATRFTLCGACKAVCS
jgi:hypothetical protein